MKNPFLIALLCGFACCRSASADQQIQDNLEVLQGFTLRGDALMEGNVSVGRLPQTQAAGFKVDVFQGTTMVEREQVIAGHYESGQVWVDDYGDVANGVHAVYVEEYGWLLTPVWIDDYGWIDVTTLVDDYGIVSETQVWVDEYGDVESIHWIETTYDGEGNVLVEGHPETTTTYGISGGHYESIPTYGITGSHPETTQEWGLTGGHWQDANAWGVTGGHYEEQPSFALGIVGSHPETQNIWIPEQRTSVTESVYGLPVVRFNGQTPDLVWSWRNVDREILELTNAGLSLPHPQDITGSSRAMLTATQFEQSYTTPTDSATYQSYGAKMTKAGLEAWADQDNTQGLLSSDNTKLKPDSIILSHSEPNANNSTSSQITRIAADDAEFGGNVAVKGVLRVKPAGNLSMGSFVAGPQP